MQTTEGAAAIGVGSLGALSAITEGLRAIREHVATWSEALTALATSPAVVVGALTIGAAVLIWRARARRLAQEVD